MLDTKHRILGTPAPKDPVRAIPGAHHILRAIFNRREAPHGPRPVWLPAPAAPSSRRADKLAPSAVCQPPPSPWPDPTYGLTTKNTKAQLVRTAYWWAQPTLRLPLANRSVAPRRYGPIGRERWIGVLFPFTDPPAGALSRQAAPHGPRPVWLPAPGAPSSSRNPGRSGGRSQWNPDGRRVRRRCLRACRGGSPCPTPQQAP